MISNLRVATSLNWDNSDTRHPTPASLALGPHGTMLPVSPDNFAAASDNEEVSSKTLVLSPNSMPSAELLVAMMHPSASIAPTRPESDTSASSESPDQGHSRNRLTQRRFVSLTVLRKHPSPPPSKPAWLSMLRFLTLPRKEVVAWSVLPTLGTAPIGIDWRPTRSPTLLAPRRVPRNASWPKLGGRFAFSSESFNINTTGLLWCRRINRRVLLHTV